MAEVTAALVKDLREKTGAGMMDCKKALTETGGDLEAAIDWLRKKGLASAAKKAGRVAAEGLVGVAVKGTSGALVECNSETDFVARNKTFQDFVATLADLAVDGDGDVETLKTTPYPGSSHTVADQGVSLVATIGENILVRRAGRLSVGSGIVGSYIHNAAAPGLGRIGVIVAIESTGDVERLTELARQLAMHIAAARPESVAVEDLDPDLVARERNVLVEQARASGKPDNIIEKMVEGRLRRFHEEVVLLEQTFVLDNESKVKQVIERMAGQLQTPIRVAGFIRFALGEGIDKGHDDFAAEVAATLGN